RFADAGAAVGDGEPDLVPAVVAVPVEPDPDGTCRRAPLGRVVEQVEHGTFQDRRPARDGRRAQGGVELDGREAQADPVDRGGYDVGQVDRFDRFGAGVLLGEVDQLVGELGQLDHLYLEVAEQP